MMLYSKMNVMTTRSVCVSLKREGASRLRHTLTEPNDSRRPAQEMKSKNKRVRPSLCMFSRCMLIGTQAYKCMRVQACACVARVLSVSLYV